jgi:hypothetical protein
MGWLLWFPLVLIAASAAASFAFIRLSSLRITADGVEIRNYPQNARVVPIDLAERFVPTEATGFLKSLRPATATLVCADGTRVPVRSLHDESGAQGIDALNGRLAAVRRNP